MLATFTSFKKLSKNLTRLDYALFYMISCFLFKISPKLTLFRFPQECFKTFFFSEKALKNLDFSDLESEIVNYSAIEKSVDHILKCNYSKITLCIS
jgi:hypothetical protein